MSRGVLKSTTYYDDKKQPLLNKEYTIDCNDFYLILCDTGDLEKGINESFLHDADKIIMLFGFNNEMKALEKVAANISQ